jgi:tetratricopeptide (TPR) repeat protein
VRSGVTYLAVGSGGNRNIDGTTDPEKVAAALDNGIRVISQAIREQNQGDNPGAWYYLGRLHLQGGDVVGADSAFAKAEQLAPACADDIRGWRQRAWVPLATPAAEFANQGKSDSAMILFRQAGTIVRNMPQAAYNIGVLYANASQADSAIKYFKEAQAIAERNSQQFANDRNSATFNLAAMYQRTDQHAMAVTELRKYIAWEPGDLDARRALASSLRATGQNDEAAEVERQVLAAAEASGTLSQNDLMSVGVNAFNDKKYQEAADAFARILTTDSLNRDAQFNLANAYLALQDGPKLIEAAAPLLAREPLSEDNHRFMAQGYRFANNQDKLMEVVTQLIAMPTAVVIDRFQPRQGGAVLAGHAIGRQAETATGASVPPAARTITVEFLNAQGAVVSSKDVAFPALEPAVKFDWTVDGEGDGIVAWRYRVK